MKTTVNERLTTGPATCVRLTATTANTYEPAASGPARNGELQCDHGGGVLREDAYSRHLNVE